MVRRVRLLRGGQRLAARGAQAAGGGGVDASRGLVVELAGALFELPV